MDWGEEFAGRPDALPAGWRRHARRAHLDLIARWVGQPRGRWLKTDLFEETSDRRALVPALAGSWVGIDVSPQVLRRARAHLPTSAVTDVRRLPFAGGAFDGVLSTSTLDHFPVLDDIDVALRELRRVLRPRGLLVLTLDNAANPLVRLRNALPPRVRTASRLVPYHVGPTLAAGSGTRALERAGFAVDDVTHLLHAPHVVGTRPARWPWWERRALPAFDRAGGTALSPVTGHFVAFLAHAR